MMLPAAEISKPVRFQPGGLSGVKWRHHSRRRFTTNKTYEEVEAEREKLVVQVRYRTIEKAHRKLSDACDAIGVFYPGADWLRRKGMAALVDEITKAQQDLLVIIQAIGNPDREDLQKSYVESLTRE